MFPMRVSEEILLVTEDIPMFLPLPERYEVCTLHSEGDVWRESPCESCLCRHGQRFCFSQTCPVLQCQHPVMHKGHCCPSCPGMD